MTQAITTTAPQKNGSGKKGTGTLAKLMARVTEDETGKGGRIRRRRLSFVIHPEVCEPGTFDDPFELLVESPSAEQELAAAKKYGSEPGAMVLELIRMCIVSVDGDPVKEGDLSRDAVWEALGITGRSLVARKFQELSGASEEATKKANESTRLLVG